MLDCQIRSGSPLKLLEEEAQHILRLLLAAHNGGDLRLDVRPDHVDAGGLGPEAHPIAPPLLDDLRLLQLQLPRRRG